MYLDEDADSLQIGVSLLTHQGSYTEGFFTVTAPPSGRLPPFPISPEGRVELGKIMQNHYVLSCSCTSRIYATFTHKALWPAKQSQG